MAVCTVADDNLSNRFLEMFISKFSFTCKACSFHSVCLESSLRRVCSGLLLYRVRRWRSGRVCWSTIIALFFREVDEVDYDYLSGAWICVVLKEKKRKEKHTAAIDSWAKTESVLAYIYISLLLYYGSQTSVVTILQTNLLHLISKEVWLMQ